MTKKELENKIATFTGGRAAEEIVFGEITTGASNDIELLFAAIDLACIVGGFCGTDKFPIEVRHLQRIAFPQTDSIQPLKNNISNDTIR